MPRRVDLSTFECSVARTLEVVGDKWSILVLRDAFYGVRRFEDFTRDLGIARNVLADRLARLVEGGVLERRQYQAHPPRFEYPLTAKGRDLLPVLLTMMHWGDTWEEREGDAPVTLIHAVCGNATHALAACADCGGELTRSNVRVEPLPPAIAEVVERRRVAQAG